MCISKLHNNSRQCWPKHGGLRNHGERRTVRVSVIGRLLDSNHLMETDLNISVAYVKIQFLLCTTSHYCYQFKEISVIHCMYLIAVSVAKTLVLMCVDHDRNQWMFPYILRYALHSLFLIMRIIKEARVHQVRRDMKTLSISPVPCVDVWMGVGVFF